MTYIILEIFHVYVAVTNLKNYYSLNCEQNIQLYRAILLSNIDSWILFD